MKPNRIAFGVFVAIVAPIFAVEPVKPSLPPASKDPVDFVKDIQPIFAKSCIKCHDANKERGGVRLDDGKSAMKGGNSGPIIVPGVKGAESRLLHVVAGLDAEMKMPPEGPALAAADIGKIRAWIEAGAKWPESTAAKQDPGASRSHWAFQPLRRPAVPRVSTPDWVKNPIDAFVLAKLDAEKVLPSNPADRTTLIRRVTLDLTGLPPTWAETEAFVNDTDVDAYEKVVRRLLSSSAYGERWGRHWLDNARYADSDGFEKDTGRPWAWRYRQWVIDALNRDLPFDRFVVEQLAGDLMPNAGESQLLATGFHRNTLTNKEGGTDQEQFRVEQVVDRVNTTGKVFLGLTIGCCQCHDHKYDPLSQKEYYQFFAFFNSDKEVDRELPLPGEQTIYETKKADFDRKQAELKKSVSDHKAKLPALQAEWESNLKLAQLRSLPPAIQQVLLKDPKDRDPKTAGELAKYFADQDGTLKKLQKAVADHAKTAPSLSKAPILVAGDPRTTRIMIRGDFLRPGVEVQSGTPSVLPPLQSDKPTRKDLAEWIVRSDNPLTSRVLANWVWHKFFGRGIVATLEDFGTQGEKPSHPELLDWLATEVMQRGWSLKQLHELIVTSATYQQSSANRADLVDRDPLNIWLARQSRLRLEAEVIRDVALSASGLLSPRVGGPSVRPPQPAGISDLTYAGSARWEVSPGPDRYRRGLYTWFQRTSPHPMLMTFDAPDSNVCVVRRERSNTPLQALTLLNDGTFVECAQSLARNALVLPDDPARQLFLQGLARSPSSAELSRVRALQRELLQMAKANPAEASKIAGQPMQGIDPAELAAWVGTARVILNLDEFVTRE